MAEIDTIVKDSEKLTKLFGGRWPEFHDAEIEDMHFWRGKIWPGKWDDRNVFPKLTLKIQILEATQIGANHAGNDVLATIRFHDIGNFKLQEFNEMNSIMGLTITRRERKNQSGELLTPDYRVDFESFATFSCFGIEVLDAVPFEGQS